MILRLDIINRQIVPEEYQTPMPNDHKTRVPKNLSTRQDHQTYMFTNLILSPLQYLHLTKVTFLVAARLSWIQLFKFGKFLSNLRIWEVSLVLDLLMVRWSVAAACIIGFSLGPSHDLRMHGDKRWYKMTIQEPMSESRAQYEGASDEKRSLQQT